MAGLWTPGGGETNDDNLTLNAMSALARGRTGQADDSDDKREMRLNRRAAFSKNAGMSGPNAGANISFATGRPKDPMFYWEQNNLPYDVRKPGEMKKIRAYCRLLYLTHPIIASCIDIYAKYPLTGMQLQCKDEALTEFYTTLFFDQLNYEEYLIDVGREYWTCALPGEMVQTLAGAQAIEAIADGTSVLTHKGRYRSVLRTTETQYDGRVIQVKPHYGLPINYTVGHEILTATGWKPIEDVTLDDSLFVPVDKTTRDTQTISTWDTLAQEDWETFDPEDHETVAYTKSGKWMRKARNQRLVAEGVAPGTIMRERCPVAGRYSMLAPEHEVTDNLLRLFGLYLAEGCNTGDGPQWSYSDKETHLVDETISLIKQCFGIEAKIKSGKGSTSVVAYNVTLGKWLEGLFGSRSKNKHMPAWMMALPVQRLAPVLDGLFEGDGHYASFDGPTKRASYKLATSSPVLREQAASCIRRAGFVSVCSEANSVTKAGTPCTWWNVGPSQAEVVDFMRFLGWTEEKIGINGGRPATYPRYATRVATGYWVKVHKISSFDYSGPVYDLTVEEDHSFVTSIAVHNCGEAWPLGQFNETLGVWEDDELINPDDVEVIKTPFQKEPRFEMRLPETLRELIEKREPAWEYEALMRNYPELAQFVAPDARMPVSNVLLKQLRFKADTFHPRGIPILMRGFRAIMQEEMLNAAQDAIADRLYTPLILARLGASASDLGTSVPWIPTEDDLTDFEEALDAALAADFRVLTHHFALQMDSVFGRESMPNFSPDFDRLIDRQLQVFGLSRTMLNGASGGETYAADALNRDLVSQLLTTYQRMVKKLYRDRALVVAEAQEHYDYEERGGKKYPIMEEVLEVDEESGEERIVEKPKLLVPDLNIKAMSFSDESTQRQLIEALKESGVPISMETRLTNIPIDLDDEIEKSKEENTKLAVASEETRKATFLALRAAGLPIPDDLDADFTPMAQDAPSNPNQDNMPVPLPSIGMDQPDAIGIAPTPEDYMAAEQEGIDPSAGADASAAQQAAMGGGTVIPMPQNKQRPPESDEQRAGMPRASKFKDPDGRVVEEGTRRLLSGPSHLGRRAKLDPMLPFDDQEEVAE